MHISHSKFCFQSLKQQQKQKSQFNSHCLNISLTNENFALLCIVLYSTATTVSLNQTSWQV